MPTLIAKRTDKSKLTMEIEKSQHQKSRWHIRVDDAKCHMVFLEIVKKEPDVWVSEFEDSIHVYVKGLGTFSVTTLTTEVDYRTR